MKFIWISEGAAVNRSTISSLRLSGLRQLYPPQLPDVQRIIHPPHGLFAAPRVALALDRK